jgi:hypothetical protein
MSFAKHARFTMLTVLLGLYAAGAALLEDLPLVDPDVAAYQVSSHNKKGLNGDGGFYLHDDDEAEAEGLAGWADVERVRGEVGLPAGAKASILDVRGAGAIAAIRLRLLPEARAALDSLWLCMEWDGRRPDVEAPVGFFFGAGVRWQDIPSHALGIAGEEGYAFFPMPFWERARIRIENRGGTDAGRGAWTIGDLRAFSYVRTPIAAETR